MNPLANPYDDLPYKSCPIEWTAPERLALASCLHGGPRTRVDSYRVLELGCGNGANLLPMAYYRQHGTFVGVDSARSQIDVAQSRRDELKLTNLEFVHADFRTAAEQLSGQFDYIIAHGVFSWVPVDVRDALLELFANCLRPGGLVYVNYNTRPGWNIRGLVREFLLAQTAGETDLRARVQLAYEVCSKVIAGLTDVAHPYSQLLAREFRFVCDGDSTWVGHEYLTPDNHPYWRSEFLALARQYRLEYVADADFNYSTGRIPDDLMPRLEIEQISGRCSEDTIDLLCFRQLHSPILSLQPMCRQSLEPVEFGRFFAASCLKHCAELDDGERWWFTHPSGYEVEAKEESIRRGLEKLQRVWPRGLPVVAAFEDVRRIGDDLKLLQRNGLVELRLVEPADCGVSGEALNRLEREWGGYQTTPYHTTESMLISGSAVASAAAGA